MMNKFNLKQFEALLSEEDQLEIKKLNTKIRGGNSPLKGEGVEE